MSTAVDRYPPFGLRVVAGSLELRGLTDDLLMELCDVAEAGIHDPGEMPFYLPWSTAPVGDRHRLTPETFVRSDVPIDVTGAEGVRAFLGLGRGGAA